jgi:alkylation response protein AidB-like acyl-CoA dehydrogenase
MGWLGETEKLWEDMRDFTKTRIQGGKPIIQHTNVGMLIAEADVLLQTSRLLQYQFAWECDTHRKPGTPISPLGWWYNNYWHKFVIQRIVQIGLEVYGGVASSKDLYFERWIRMQYSVIHGGSTGALNLIKASKIL